MYFPQKSLEDKYSLEFNNLTIFLLSDYLQKTQSFSYKFLSVILYDDILQT